MAPEDLLLTGFDLYLRPPTLNDFQAWQEERSSSRSHTEPWQPSWADDELSEGSFKRRLEGYHAQLRSGTGYPFMIFRASDDAFIGMCILSDVRRGVLQAGNIGYWIGTNYVRQGHGRNAVRLVLDFAFNTLELNRVEAATLPENVASSALLKSIGFSEEGLSRRFLKINGQWRDHLKLAILHDDDRL